MPPRLKKVGRPVGSKNKKGTKIKNVLKEIKSEPNLIKTENVSNGEMDTNIRSKTLLYETEDNNESDSDNQYSGQDASNIVDQIGYKKVIYNCKKCPNKNFKFKKNFKEHLLLEHSTLPGSIECKLCNAVCPNEDTLNAHFSKAHNRSVFKCKHCNKEFVRQAHVLRHMAQKGCDGGTIASFPCEICDARFTRKDNLIVHLRQMHIQRVCYRCKHTKCQFTSKNFTKLIRHWHAVHAEVPNEFECDICGKSTMSRAAMAKHLEIHGEKKYSCDVCGYSTYTIEVMRRHILTHVDDKPYKCTICGSSYIQRAQLERHMVKHNETICDVCGDEFTCKARLLIHRKHHEGKQKLQCPFIGCAYAAKTFLNMDSLVTHVNKHLQLQQTTKSWKCDVCHKLFPTEIYMRRHLSTHTLDRPRRCMYCVSARAYVRGQQLVRHVRKFHPTVFNDHLKHVRNVLSTQPKGTRVNRSEMESILNLLDAESERILEGYGGGGVLYGGMQTEPNAQDIEPEENSPLMSEEVLAENLSKLLAHLIDEDTLQCFGWPDEPVDTILEKVIEQCGAKPADREMWSRVQRLRENAKHLFLYVVDDKNVSVMLGTHTIDQIIKHILTQVAPAETDLKQPHGTIEIELEVS